MRKFVMFGLFVVALSAVSFIEEGSSNTNIKRFSIIPNAEAIVGRPLTPVSVAGVARRTVRRCAVGVYNCY